MQTLIMYLIVAAAAGYAAWLFMPHALRQRLIAVLSKLAPSQRAALERLGSKAECGGCSSCKGCEAGTQPAPAHPLQPTSRADGKPPNTRAAPELHP